LSCELAQVTEEELLSPFHTAFDLGAALWGWHEMAAFTALIEFDAVDIDTFAGQLAGEVDRVRGDPSFQRSASALFASAGNRFGTVAFEQGKPI
jgi:hypothetical protein